MDGILERLFESVPKVRVLRLFMRNPDNPFAFHEIVKRSQIRSKRVRTEVRKLLKLNIIESKKVRQPERKRRIEVFSTNPEFYFFTELQELINKGSTASRKKLLRQIKSLGSVKLAVISGIFLNNDARTDLLLVGDGVKKKKIENLLIQLESELGKSVRYTLMDTDEFKYRIDMYDRFLRDILEYKNEKLINKFDI